LLGVPEELVALLVYVPVCAAGPLAGIGVLAFARRRPWLRAHAWQGLLLGALAALVVVVLWLADFALEVSGLPTPGLATVVLQLAVAAAYLAVSLRCMVDAYRRRDATLPLIGARARRWALRRTRP
jgi:uncharacterized membrane protein